MIAASTHLTWDPRVDYVKYAQSLWLQKSIAKFVSERQLDDASVVLCGDFNSTPDSSTIHCMHNKHYTPNVMKDEVYRSEFGQNCFKMVDDDFAKAQ